MDTTTNDPTTPADPTDPPDVSAGGNVIDGYLRGATVFVDENGNGIFDSGETSTTTNVLGQYTLSIPSQFAGQPVYVTGGVDVTTGLRFEGILKAPGGSGTAATVTPLTTLIQHMVDNGVATNADAAHDAVLTALGFSLPAGEDLRNFDPLAQTHGATFSAGLKIMSTVQILTKAITGTNANLTTSEVIEEVMSALANQIAAGSPAFDSDDGLEAILNTVAANVTGFTGTDVTDHVAASVGPLIREVTGHFNTYTGDDAATFDALAQAAHHAMGAVANHLNTVAGASFSGVDSSYFSTYLSDASHVSFASGTNVINGTAAGETLAGSSGRDIIDGLSGSDTITAGDGADVVFGEAGNDVIEGGIGNDTIYGDDGDDTAVFNANVEEFTFSVTFDSNGDVDAGTVTHYDGTAGGGLGTDTLYDVETLQFADQTIDLANLREAATSGDDLLLGDEGTQSISAGDGNDLVYAQHGDDTIDGGAGNDLLIGGAGNDDLNGGAGDDTLIGGAGNDIYTLSEGNDTIVPDAGNDELILELTDRTVKTLEKSGANLVVTFTDTNNNDHTTTVTGVFGLTPLQSITFTSAGDDPETFTFTPGDTASGGDEILFATSGGSTLTGGAGRDFLVGSSGDDELNGGTGDNAFLGGAGNDTINGSTDSLDFDEVIYETATSGVTVDLAAGSATGGAGTDILNDIEGVSGSQYNDVITGDADDNDLYGEGGDDTLDGGAGDDYLFGGDGDDTLIYDGVDGLVSGDDGNDTVVIQNDGAYSIAYGPTDPSAPTVPSGAVDAYAALYEIENILLSGANSNDLYMDAAGVIQVTDSNNRLVIQGDNQDQVRLIDNFGTWNQSGTRSDATGNYTIFQATVGAETAYIEVEDGIDFSSFGAVSLDITDTSNFDSVSTTVLNLSGQSDVLNLNFTSGANAGDSFQIVTHTDGTADPLQEFETINVTGLAANQSVELIYTANGIEAVVNEPPQALGVEGSVSSLQFDGVEDKVTLNDATNILTGAGAFTYETWFKSSATGLQSLLDVGAVAAGQGAGMFIDASGNLSGSVNSQFSIASDVDPVNDGQWHHAAFSHDGGGSYTLYLDGVLAGSTTSTTPNLASGSLVIGDNNAGSAPFEGEIADVRAWSLARTADEIADNYRHVLETPESVSENPGLVANWTFDSINADGTATDLTLTGNDAQVLQGPPVDLRADVATFDGDGDYIDLGTGANLISSDFTWETWVKLDSPPAGGEVLIQLGTEGNSSESARLQINSSGLAEFVVFNAVGHPSGTTNIADGTWHHVAVSYSATSPANQLQIIVDGIVETTANPTAPGLVAGTAALGATGVPSLNFDGEMADVRFWDSARTDTQISAEKDVRLNGDETGLLGYFPLNGDASDAQTNTTAIDGTLVGNAAFVDSSPLLLGDNVRHGMTFDPTTLDSVGLGQSAAAALEVGGGSFTLEGWFQTEASSSLNQQIILFGGTSGSLRLGLAVNASDQLQVTAAGNTLNTDITVNDGGWHHAAATFDSSTNDLTLYLDGSAAATVNVPGGINYDAATEAGAIGSSRSQAEWFFDGSLSDIRFWDAARTGDEIRAEMNGYVAPDHPDLVANWRLDGTAGETAPGDDVIDYAGGLDGVVAGTPAYLSDPVPIAALDASINEDTPLTGSIIADDFAGEAITFSVAPDGAPENGTLTIDETTGAYSYRPAKDFNGIDTFTVKVVDEYGAIGTQQITVTIDPQADAPAVLGASDGQIFVQLDGTDDYLHVDDSFSVDFGASDYTLEAWVDLASLGSSMALFDKRDTDGAGVYAFVDASGFINLSMSDGAQLNVGGSSSGAIDADGWHHVAISVDRDGNADFYIDGMLSGSADASTADGLAFANNAPLLIGKTYDDANPNHFQGAIDEIRIWKEARTDLEIAQNYATKITAPTAETTLAGYWNFDNIDTHDEEYADDLSAYDNRLYAGDPLLDGGADPASGESVNHLVRASEFNGTSSSIDLSANVAALSSGTGSFTYEAWVKTTATTDGEIVAIGDSPATNSGSQFRVLADGTVKLQTVGNAAGPNSTATVNDGLWHHVAVRYDANTGLATLVIDGEEDGSAAMTPNLGSSYAYIGDNYDSSKHFDGEIADVRIWSYARDTGEIADGRENFPQPDEEGLLAHYKLDGGGGAVVVDSSDNGYDGTPTNVAVNDAGAGVFVTPITFNEDQDFTGRIGAIDPDGATTLTFTVQNGATTTQGASVSVGADGSFVYYPVEGYLGFDTFDVTVADAEGNTTTQTITVNVAAYDDPPALLGVAPTSGALQFDGVGDGVQLGDGTGTGLVTGSGDFTYEIWFKRDAGTLANDEALFQIGASATNQRANLHMNTNGTLDFDLYNNENGPTSASAYNDGEWHHAAVVNSGGTVTLYIDGQSEGTASYSPNIAVGGAVIGNSTEGTNTFTGELDEARIWSEARTIDEIQLNYQQRLDGSVDTTNLEGYWRFDQINDDGTASDLSGNERDAVVGHGSPADAFAPVMSFNGSSDEITTAAPPPISGSHSVEAWYRTTSTGTVAVVSSNDVGADGTNAMQIYVTNGQPNVEVAGTGGIDVFTLSANSTNDGEWHHIAYSYDVSTQTFAAYLDGAPAGGSLTFNQDIGTFAPDGELQIGINRLGSANFDGEISDVRVWDDIRTAAEVAENYDTRLNGREEDLAAYYRLDADGTDSTLNSNDGTVTGTTLLADASPTPIPFARSLELDGSDDYVSISGAPASMSAITYEAWIKPDTVSAVGNIVSKASDTFGTSFVVWSDGRLALQTDGGGWTTSTSTVAANEWQHVAVSYDPAAAGGTMTFYIDGVKDNTITGVGGTIDPSTLFAIGSQDGDAAANLFDGNIADVRIWNDVRTENEIRDGMSGYVGGDEPGLIGNWRLNDDLGGATTVADSAGGNNGTTVGDPQFVDGAAPVYSYEFTTDEDIAVHGSLVAQDVDTASLTFSIGKSADHGSLDLNSDGTFVYTPAGNYSGADSFQVRVSDGNTTSTRTISISVDAQNDIPEILGAQTRSGVLQFDGIDDYVQVDHADDLNPGEGSFSVQIMADFRDTTTLQSLISKGNATSSTEGWNIFIESGYLYARMGDGGTDASDKAELRYDLTGIDGWHDVAFTLDRDAGTFEAYFDGSSTGWTPTAGRDNDPSGWDISNTESLLVGKTATDTGFANTSVDEVRVWNKALSADEIANNQNTELTGSETGLAAYWQLEAAQYNAVTDVFADQTGNGHDAYLGDITPGDDAQPMFLIPPVQAMEFSGADNIVVPDNDQLSTGTDDFSIEAWIYRTNSGTEEVIIDNRDSAFKGWMLGVSASNTLELAMEDANGNTSNVFSTAVIPTDQWVHVAVTADRDGDATFYVNGAKGGTASIESSPGSLTAVSNLLIGDTDTAGSTYGGWTGMLSDVRIWDHVRDASDIGGDNFGHLQQPQDGLLGNWRLDDDSTTGEVVDYSGNGNTGAITGATSVSTARDIYETSMSVDEDTPFVGLLKSTDAEGDAVTWALETGPAHGEIAILSNGSFKYVPDGEYAGADSFTARITDANGGTRTQTFAITVSDRSDAPEILGISAHETTLQFDGTSALSAGRGTGDALAITGDLTVEMWVNPAELKLSHLLSFGTNTETLEGNTLYSLEMQADGALRLFHEDASLNNVTPTTTAPILGAGEWAHIAATRDTANNEVSFYLNGELFETVSYTGQAAGGSDAELLFGALDLDDDFTGQMDEVRVWNSVRTEAQIADTYQRKLSDAEIDNATNLVGYWDFDETNADGSYTDLSGSGADAYQGRADLVHSSTHVSNYITLDGAGDFITVPTSVDYDFNTAASTYEAWVRTTGNGGVDQVIFSQQETNTRHVSLAIDGATGQAAVNIDGVGEYAFGPDITDGEWHHVSLARSTELSLSNTYTITVDGVEVGSQTNAALTMDMDGVVAIGETVFGTNRFNGDIADVRVWDTERTNAEINQFMGTTPTGGDATGLVANWLLDDASGSTAVDSISANDGTLVGDAVFGSDTVDRHAIASHVASHATFDGIVGATGDNIAIPDNAAYETTTLSVEVWFRAEVVQEAGASFHRLVTKPTTGNGNVFSLGFSEATGQLFGAAGSSFITPANGAGPDVRDGEWHHAAMTMQPGTNASSLYLDGVLIHTGTQGAVAGDASPLMIGDYDDDGSHPQNFKGDIADVRIWSDIRTQAEIRENLITDLDGSEAGLVGHWKLDSASGSTVADISVTGNDGTLQNGAAIVDEAPLPVPVTGDALSFDGTGDIVRIDDPSLLETGGDAFTFSAWVNADDVSDGNNKVLFQVGDNVTSGDMFVVFVNNGTINADFSYQPGPESTSDIRGQWAHVAVTYDGAGTMTLFVNGEEETSVSSLTSAITGSSYANIGGFEVSPSTITDSFAGELSNVGFWSGAFNEAQIQAEMLGGLDTSADNVLGYWPLNEGAGATVEDLSRSGNDGVIEGATWVDTGPDIYANQTFVLEGEILRGDIGVRDADAGETYTFSVVSDTHFGELTVDATTGSFVYEPVPNFSGQDSFTVSVTDSDGYTTQKELTIEVDNVFNEAPVADGYDGGSHVSLADADAVTMAGVGAAAATDFTIETWFRADGSQDDGDLLFGNGTLEYGVKFNASGGLNAFVDSTVATGPAVNVLDGGWHHVALTYNGTTNDFNVVVDGQAGTPGSQAFSGASANLTFGSATSGLGLIGDIDEMRLWNTERSVEEIQLTKNTTVDPNDLALDAYWRADEGAGTTLTDLTGNGNNTTVPVGALQSDDNPTLALSHTGRSSLNFADAFSSIVSLDAVTLPNDAFAFTLWAQVQESSTENRLIEIDDTAGSGAIPFKLSVGNEGELIIRIDDGTNVVTQTLDVGWSYDKWSHIGVSFDGDDLNVYLDGELAGTVDGSTITSPFNPSGDLFLGNSNVAPGLGFTGNLSEFRMWNTDITEAMARTDMLGRVPADNIQDVGGYWPLSDGAAETVFDHSGNGHTGTAFAVLATDDVPPQPGTAAGIDFDGTTSYLKAAYDGEGENALALKGDMTVEFWVNPDIFGSGRVFSFAGEAAADTEEYNSLYELYITTGGDVQWVQEQGAGTDASPAAFTSTGISTGDWSHVAVTRDAAAKTVTLYVDGTQVGSPVVYTAPPTGGEDGELFIGANGGLQHFFDGQIADFRIWDHVRTQTEISTHLSHELVGGEEGLVGYWPMTDGSENTARDLTGNAADAALFGAADWVSGTAITTDESVTVNGRVVAGDLDSDDLTFSLESDGVNGSVTLNADGTYSYTPTASYTGPDAFTVKVTDALGNVDYTTVSVSVVGGAVIWTPSGSDDPLVDGNWSSGLVPTAYDIVTTTTDGTSTDPMLDGSLSVGRLDVLGTGDFHVSATGNLTLAADGSQVASGATMTLYGLLDGDGGLDVVSGGTLDWYDGAIATDRAVTVDGTLTINGGAKELHSDLVITGTAHTPGTSTVITGTGALHNAGGFTTEWGATIGVDFVNLVGGTVTPTAAQRTLTFNGTLENYGTIGSSASKSLSLIASEHVLNAGTLDIIVSDLSSLPTFNFNGGMTNTGTVNLARTVNSSYDAKLDVDGTFVNEGTINVSADFDVSAHQMTIGTFQNRGVLNIDHSLDVSTSGSAVVVDLRGGTLDIASGATFSVTGSGATIIIDETTTLTGDGTLFVGSGAAVQLAGDFVYDSTMPALDFYSSNDFESFDGNEYTFTIGVGAEINSQSTFDFASTIHVVNEGSITTYDNTSFFRGGLENDVTGTITVKGAGNGGVSRLSVTSDLINRGTITLAEPDATNSDIELIVGGDSNLENFGTITTSHPGGASGSTFLVAGQLINYGTLNANHDLELNSGTATDNHVNRGTVNIATGATLVIGAGDTFTNDDTGTVTGAGSLDVSGSADSTLTNNGIIETAGYDTAGALHIVGNMVNSDSSVIDIEVGNGENDTLNVSGEITLNGTLNASFITASTPTVGDVFNVVSFGSSTAGSYFDDINGLEGDGTTMLDILINEASGITFTAVNNAIAPTVGNDTFDGTSAADYAYGGDGNDDLVGGGGADVLIGGAGDDTIEITDNNFHFVDGGDGTDTLTAFNGLDMTNVRNETIDGFERLDLGFGPLTLDGDDVVSITDGTNALTGTENTLVVTRNDFGGAIDIGSGWSAATSKTLTIGGETKTFDVQTHATSGATIYIEQAAASLATDLDGTNGFTINPENGTGDIFAFSATQGVGDVNGDGFEDFTYSTDLPGEVGETRTYLVYGSAAGFGASIDIDVLRDAGGALEITGTDESSVHNMVLGDVNGDGYDDFALGMSYDDTNGTDAGRVAIVLGGESLGTNGVLDLSTLDGTNGYQIYGNAGDELSSISAGGDVNGDGFVDISFADRNTNGTGYILYGNMLAAADAADSMTNDVDGVIDISLLHAANGGDGTLGFTMTTNNGSDGTIYPRINGDIDGDGFADMILVNRLADTTNGTDTGRAILVFGSAAASGADRDYSTATAGSVVHLEGALAGNAVNDARYADINGDGLDDVILSTAGTNTGYVVYGKDDWSMTETVNLGTLSSSDGFAFTLDASTTSYAMGALGDINGDGIEDFGFLDRTLQKGYAVFGGDFDGATFDVSAMNGEDGFSYDISNTDGAYTLGVDINGDGFDDIFSTSMVADEGYVIYGGDFFGDVDSVGTAGADTLVGTADNDILDGGDGGADVLIGGAGDDRLIIGDANFARIDGGGGQDTLFIDNMFNLDFREISNGLVTGIEHLNMDNGLANMLDIDFSSVLDIGEAIDQLVGEANMLVISGDDQDTVNLDGNWTQREEQPAAASAGGYTVYDSDDSSASVAIQNAVQTNLPS